MIKIGEEMSRGAYVRTEEHKRKLSEAMRGKNNPNFGKFGEENSNYRHGGCYTRLYHIWSDMKQRCTNRKAHDFKYYGAKQIYVIPKWQLSFENFRDWAINNGYDDTLTIDRIDPSEGYYPQNCQWITLSENSKKSNKMG